MTMGYTDGQKKCITTLDRSLVVSAGAGSGKTFTLTKRIAYAFESGYLDDIDQVLAITFTRKAASELKSRLKAELRAIGRVDQALKVDDAWVSTIHGMCARMLRAHALEVGIDPAFEVAESAQVEDLRQRAIDQELRALQSGSSSAALDSLFSGYTARSGFGNSSIEAMVEKLVALAGSSEDGLAHAVTRDSSSSPFPLFERAVAVVEDLMPLADQVKDSKSKGDWLALVASLRANAENLCGKYAGPLLDEASTEALALEMLEVLAPMKFPQNFGDNVFKAAVADAQLSYLACTQELRLVAADGNMAALVALAHAAWERFNGYKAAAGILDNDDLLVLASRMMRDHPDIAALYADKFKLIMVDEFQDTDQMQVDMIKRLAGPGACRLCTVGDAQQSIYRFRGADVLVYRRHLATVQAADADSVILLPDNFRSHPDVLKFVDRVFEQPTMFGGSFMSLAAGRDEGKVACPFVGEGPRIEVQVTTHPSSRGANTDEARAVAAHRIAARFAQLVAQGQSAGDMVILLGTMGHSDVYAQALRDAGLACVIAGGSVFAASPEVTLAKALLRVAANPRETEALYEVLASPLFALSAGDFLQLATADAGGASPEGSVRRRSLDVGVVQLAQALRDGAEMELSPQLACAVRTIDGMWAGAGRRTVSRLLDQVVVESGLLGRLEAQGAEGLASAGNLFKALRIIDELERSGPLGPVQLVRAFDATMEDAREAPGALSATGGEFVRIMTVHASKGLEFPVVAVAEVRMGASSTDVLQARRIDGKIHLSLDLGSVHDDFGPSMKVESKKRQAFAESVLGEGLDEEELLAIAGGEPDALKHRLALAQADSLGDAEEAKRLLYVALTRAKEALVVSLHDTMGKDSSSYQPEGVYAGIVNALDKSGHGLAVGTTRYEFGGSRPARVELVHLAEKGAGATWVESQMPQVPADEATRPFAVGAPLDGVRVSRVNYRPAREGVFSYSSVAGAAHEGDLPARLANAFCIAVDEAAVDAPTLGGEGDKAYDQVFWSNRGAAVLDEDDGSWAYAGESVADDDKATDLGTAFHRLAQFAVVTRAGAGELVAPPVKHVDALARTCRLGETSRARLEQALDRWFASDVAAEMGAFADLRAEVPFLVALDDGAGGCAYLDGEIDLLALSDDGSRAFVVDYKTGGHADETPDQLAEKHVLQASCYALALLRQGIEEVHATFVRVEQPRAGREECPQCVRYRFTAADLSMLETGVAEAYHRA